MVVWIHRMHQSIHPYRCCNPLSIRFHSWMLRHTHHNELKEGASSLGTAWPFLLALAGSRFLATRDFFQYFFPSIGDHTKCEKLTICQIRAAYVTSIVYLARIR